MAQNYFGFKKPANKIVIAATDSCFYSEYKLESATNAYACLLYTSPSPRDS